MSEMRILRAVVFPLIVCISVMLYGMFKIDLMEHDATQYATISMQMMQTNNWLEIYWRTVNYLDKPPLLFWVNAALFKIFGISSFVYRLPSFLFFFVGVYSVFRLGTKYLTKEGGLIAALVLISFQASFLLLNDVRTDTMLMGWVALAIWQFDAWFEDKKIISLLYGSIAVAFAMLTKGPIGLMVPVLALGTNLIINRKWKEIVDVRILLVIPFVILLLTPMLIGLYKQHGATGIEFFFWTQSFGRITGENVWHDNTGPFYFVHNLLWAALPWTLLFLYGLFKLGFNLLLNRKNQLGFAFYGFVLVFIAISTSSYKLPHYLFVLLPFMSLIIGRTFMYNSQKQQLILGKIQFAINILLWLVLAVLFYFDPPNSWSVILGTVVLFNFSVFQFIQWRKSFLALQFILSFKVIVAINLYLNGQFYPQLLQFQSGGVAAKKVLKTYDTNLPLCYLNQHRSSFDFYYHQIVPDYHTIAQLDSAMKVNGKMLVFTDEKGYDSLKLKQYEIEETTIFNDLKVSQLSLPYLVKKNRENLMKKTYLVKLGSPKYSRNELFDFYLLLLN